MTKGALRLTASALALAAPLAIAGLAHAADVDAAAAADADAPVATAPATATVPPVTITAERRTVNLQTAPIAATVISGEQLKAQGINTVDDLQFHSPSVVVADFGQGALFNIRGLGKDLTNVQTPSGVVTYYDGVALYPGFFGNIPYFDISNIELLRGPQGTFAGQNADAGAVFVTTNDPLLGSWSGYGELQKGSYSDTRLQGFINMPVGDDAALRFSFSGESRDTFYKLSGPYTTPSTRQPGSLLAGDLRIGFLWDPTPHLRIDVKGSLDYVDNGGFLGDPSLDPAGTALNPKDPFHITLFTDNYGTNKNYRVVSNIGYTFDDGIVLKSITGYQYGQGNGNIDLLELNLPGSAFEDFGRETIFSQEINLVSPDTGPLRWVGGLYYQHDYVTLLPGGGLPGFDIHVVIPGVVTEDEELIYRTPKTTEAAFGQVSYDITQALQLQVGLRYTDESFGLRDTAPLLIDGFTVSAPSFVAHTSDSGLTGKVALNWKLNEDNFLYAFVATGRKAAGINTTPAGAQTAPVPFGPETVTDYEAGWKPTFFDDHLRAQLGFYYTDYKNFQLSFGTPNAPTMNFIRNAGGTTVLYGVELEAQAVFGPLSFDLGGSYEHSSLGATLVVDPVSGAPVQLSGRQAPLAPPWTANVGAQYAIGLPNGARLTPRIDYSYVDGQWATPYQDLGDFMPARNLVNATLAYAADAYSVTLYATNAFNSHYIIATNIGLRYAGNPGQYGVRVAKSF